MESAGLITYKNDQHMSFMFQVFVGQLVWERHYIESEDGVRC